MKPYDNTPVFAMVAGEPSGDELAAGLILALKKIYPTAKFVGIAGPKMIAAGCDALFPMESLAVMGLVVRQLLDILSIRRQFLKYCLTLQPTLFIGIDAPDFNLSLEKKLKAKGIVTAHCVSPSIWAWRAGRIRTIAKATDVMFTLFPFETPLYDAAGILAFYVGHPLADAISLERDSLSAREQLQVPPTKKIVAILPGSRHAELVRMVPVFLEAARLCYQKNSQLQFIVPMVNKARALQFQELAAPFSDLPLQVVLQQTQTVLRAADAALITSGTATLEAALLQCPMVMAYKTSFLSACIGRWLIKIRHFALPNILLGTKVVPEYMQDKATPAVLSQALTRVLEDDSTDMIKNFQTLHLALKQNSYETTAHIIQTLLKEES